MSLLVQKKQNFSSKQKGGNELKGDSSCLQTEEEGEEKRKR